MRNLEYLIGLCLMSSFFVIVQGLTLDGRDRSTLEHVKWKSKLSVWVKSYEKNGSQISQRLERHLDGFTRKTNNGKLLSVLQCSLQVKEVGGLVERSLKVSIKAE